MRALLPFAIAPRHCKRRNYSWLRTVVALDHDEVDNRMRQAHFDVGLIFGRSVASERGRVIGKLDHDIARPAGAFGDLELAGTHQETPAVFLEDRRIRRSVWFVTVLVIDVDPPDPITLRHDALPRLNGCF